MDFKINLEDMLAVKNVFANYTRSNRHESNQFKSL